MQFLYLGASCVMHSKGVLDHSEGIEKCSCEAYGNIKHSLKVSKAQFAGVVTFHIKSSSKKPSVIGAFQVLQLPASSRPS